MVKLKTSAKIQGVARRHVFDMFYVMLIVYAVWEGWDRGVAVCGMITGMIYVVVYSQLGRLLENVVERVRCALLECFSCKVMSHFFALVIPFFINLVFCYYLLLFLVYQTVLFCEKVSKFKSIIVQL